MSSEGTADYSTLDLWLNKIMGIQEKFKRVSKKSKYNVSKKKNLSKNKNLPWILSGSLERKCTQGGPGRKN